MKLDSKITGTLDMNTWGESVIDVAILTCPKAALLETYQQVNKCNS